MKLADPSISVFLSFFVKKKEDNISNFKAAVGMQRKACACRK